MTRQPPTHEILTPEIVRHIEQLIAEGQSNRVAAVMAGVTRFVVRMVRLRMTEDAAELERAKAHARARAKSCAILNSEEKHIRKLCRGPKRLDVIRRMAAAHPALLRSDLARIAGVPCSIIIDAIGRTPRGRPPSQVRTP